MLHQLLLRSGTLLLIAAVLCCAGCSDDPSSTAQQSAEEKKKTEEAADKKTKDDYEALPLTPILGQQILQTDPSGGDSNANPLPLVKPGHWTAVSQQYRANYDDLTGYCTFTPQSRKEGEPLPLVDTPYSLTSGRPALLAKNQPKRITGEVFIPEDAPTLSVESRLQRSEYGGELLPKTSPWKKMPSYQYFFLVVAKQPERYAFLKTTDSIRSPWQDYNLGENYALHYRVALADGEKRFPLPDNALACTSLAYVLWDEVNLQRIQPNQERALVDWLHWGGRLIINGPNSLDALRGSFLDKYLPAKAGNITTLKSRDLLPLTSYWGQRRGGKPLDELEPTTPWSAITLDLFPDSHYLPHTGQLFAERQVGLGSVVVSAMQLNERDLLNWPGYDGFLNGALLGRPARQFSLEPSIGEDLQSTWAEFADRRLDAYMTTGLRWFARDTGTKANVQRTTIEAEPNPYGFPDEPDVKSTAERPGGLGAWNEFSPVSSVAREAMRAAAGVRVPGSGFVVACLALYLFVLVPLNWMLFHALGRVEWAWIAAPVIAVVGALVVIQQANLDIGFVRAQTEIGFLELHNDYNRGHLSRYTALYASLSTTYDVEFDDLSAVAAPFPSDDAKEDELRYRDTRRELLLEKVDKTRLKGLTITSSSTQFVHSEQMIELGEGLKFTTNSGKTNNIINRLGITLKDAVVVRRDRDDRSGDVRLKACWLGQLRTNESRAIPWTEVSATNKELLFAKERSAAAKGESRERLDVDDLLKLAFQFPDASDPRYGERGEYRLVARIDEPLPGTTVDPAPSQITGSTVVLAHLELDPAEAQSPDRNSPGDVLPEERNRDDFSPFIDETDKLGKK